MATPKISVVVPIYKVEECLAWCLDSLLAICSLISSFPRRA